MPYSQLSDSEVATMDRMHKKGAAPRAIIAKLQCARAKRGGAGPSQSAVYRFLNSSTYERGRADTRGRKVGLPEGLVHTAFTKRIQLICGVF